jgi:hypothetical protein
MKKSIFYLASAALVSGLAACSSDELEGEYGLTLKKNQLGATIENTVNTRVLIDGDYQMKWNNSASPKEAIGVYSSTSKSTENYKYELQTLADENPVYGVFSPATGVEVANDYVPAVAYYPYSNSSSYKILNNKLYLKLEDESTYAAGEVNTPLVGDITSNSIAFHSVTALLKVTVEGMPNDKYTKAILTNQDGLKLAGMATVDLSQPASSRTLEMTAGAEGKSISIFANSDKSTKFTTGDYDFYFIIPAEDYAQGLVFTLSDGDSTNDNLCVATPLTAEVNHIYTKTFRNNGTTWESTTIADLNDDLASGLTQVSADLKAETAAQTILVPADKEAGNNDNLEITLENIPANAAITIKEAAETKAASTTVAPRNIVIKTSQLESADVTLTINLPNSHVTLAPLDGADSKVTLNTVTSTTAGDVLLIKKGVTVTTLTASAGNVYVENGGKIGTVTGAATQYVFYETESDITAATTIVKKDQNIYHLIYPQDGDEIALPADGFTVAGAPVEISAGKDVQLDLAGKTLQTTAAISVIKVTGTGAKLTIIDTNTTATPGSITSTQGANAVIIVEKGGSVELKAGAISNTAGNAVELNNGSFTLTGGTVSAASTKDAFKAENGSSVVLKSESIITKNTKEYAVEGNLTTIVGDTQNATGSTIDLQKGAVSGKVIATGSTFKMEAGSITDATTGTATITATAGATLNITGGSITNNNTTAATTTDYVISLDASSSAVNATIKDATLTSGGVSAIAIKGGASEKVANLTIQGTTAVESAKTGTSDAEIFAIEGVSGLTKVTIEGGTFGTSKKNFDAAIYQPQEGELIIKGGSFYGAKETIELRKGSLSVPEASTAKFNAPTGAPEATVIESESKLHFQNVVLGVAPTEAASEVSVSLAASAATYEGNYVLYNKNVEESLKNPTVALNITDGKFAGDVYSDSRNHFIYGGKFKSFVNLAEQAAYYFATGHSLGDDLDDDGYLTVK